MVKRLTGLFEQIAEPTALTLAFARVRENAGGPGGDGVSIDAFAKRLANEVVALTHELISGEYVPRRARPAQMPKKSGGFRKLSIPAVRDRVVQTAASTLLVAGLDREMEDVSFGYRPGRSVQQAVRMVDKHRRDGFRWAVDADIRSYFDNVPHDRLIAKLEAHVDDGRFVDLISLWLEAYGAAGRGLPQGSPVSPVLANLYLDAMDEAFRDPALRLIRYADDFVILARSAADAEAAKDKAARLLKKEGLELHPEKTKIVPFNRGLRFLGHLFVRSLVVADPWDEAPTETVDSPPSGAPAPDSSGKDDEQRSGTPPRCRRVLYLAMAGTRADTGTGESIEVSEDGHMRLRLKAHLLERVEVHPDTDISSDALRALLAAGVPTVFVDGRGEALGSVAPREGINGVLHLAQARTILDEARRRQLAEVIVEARIHNHRALLRRLNRQRNDTAVVQACEEINRILRKLPGAEAVSSLMSYEGASAKVYWRVLGRFLPEGWVFERRGRRPPATPFDVILSYLATLVTNEVERAVFAAGLHPGFAILHASKNESSACATDLVEEFRGPVAESCAVTLVAQKAVNIDGFSRDRGLGWTMEAETRDAIIRAYERTLARPVKDPAGASSVPWRGMIERQVRRFAGAIKTGEPYVPYRMDY
ncbi:CRISPR-associated endonuclease Cas1 [Pleomorphomonas sp. NRK KF1]|uniref:CRISPR-associated endonuclease Cas1 n=1 Tax=Pleomorphomonas sp. NRK KF1 TaxID=2943000 RepID=UPI0020432370|nr:CRISPR-associated endonuclease Cas1 [Pleomorphomonas sp. NRK KF1]MCM5552395.1 CRISPR-associated endonuclease Cas1 [Pleomorphomonas sp. NRK KF1]